MGGSIVNDPQYIWDQYTEAVEQFREYPNEETRKIVDAWYLQFWKVFVANETQQFTVH